MTRRLRRLAWLPFAVLFIGAAAWLYPPLGNALLALLACAGAVALLGAACLVASRIDGRGKGGA